MSNSITRFLKTQLIFGLNVFFFYLLFSHVTSIYSSIISRKPLDSLQDLTKQEAKEVKMSIKDTLTDSEISDSLYRYFMFFYINNYDDRAVFVGEPDTKVYKEVQSLEDPFYKNMLKFHLNNNCFVQNTNNINKQSAIYRGLKSNNEIGDDTYYISCPVFIDDVLIGYIGGLTEKQNGSISTEIRAVNQSVSNVENILERL